MDITQALPDVLAVHLGNGDGTFGAAVETTLETRPIDFELAHLNGDDFLDVVVANWGGAPDRIEVFHGDGDGGFTSVQLFTAPDDNPFDVEVGDLDEDGHGDLVIYMAYDDLYLAAGLPDGTFGAPVYEDTCTLAPTKPELVDVDGDGHLDWVVVGNTNAAITVRLGDGTLALGEERIFGVGEVGGWLDFGDMDDDGLLDVVVTADVAEVPAVRTVRQLREDAWIGLGHGLPGTGGEPTMLGIGTFEGDEDITLSIAGGLPFGSTLFFLGFLELSVPFKGGLLVPNPSPGAIIPLPLDAVGGIDVPIPWPTGIPAGLPTYWQAWSQDPEGVFGWSATNAVLGVTP